MSAARTMVRALRDAGTLNISDPEEHRRQLLRITLIGTVGGMMIVFLATSFFPYFNGIDVGTLLRGPAKHASFVKPH